MNRRPESADEAGPEATTFEEALTRLGEIVARLESGSLGLSESISAYEQGVSLVRRLHEELAAAETRVSLLVRIDDEGRPVLADPEPPAAPAVGTAPKRPARGRPRNLPGMEDEAG